MKDKKNHKLITRHFSKIFSEKKTVNLHNPTFFQNNENLRDIFSKIFGTQKKIFLFTGKNS